MSKMNTIEIFKDFLESQKQKELYIQVTSVSKSGMSRKMKVRLVLDNRILNVTFHVAMLLEKKMNDDGSITVRGCGMDMCEHLVMTISRRLYDEDYAINTNYL